MNKIVSTALALAVVAGFNTAPARADNVPQLAMVPNAQMQQLASGYRASKIIGSSVVNDNNDSIGKVDDLISSPDQKNTFAVISVGGFLGMGDRLVVLPYDELKVTQDKVMLPGATKNALKQLPEFHYARS